ncbi:MAG: adenylate/guanylate cyclase domain-containing protein [Planctomycetota bacterium]|jgi:class 3 adenylate cyclase
MPSRVLTVMFTDIKGFTERTSNSSRIELRKILAEHETLLRPVVEDFGGRVVKTVGDAFMVVFESPTNAVLCGIMIQERLRERNETLPRKEHLEVRVALNSGEVVEREGDFFGDAVNIASRIEGITEVGEIYFTESVYLAMNKAEVPSSEVGTRRLKGIPEAIRVYSVIRDENSERYRQLIEELRNRRFDDVPVPSTGEHPPVRRRAPVAGIAIAALGALVAVVVVVVLIVSWTRMTDSTPGPTAEGTKPADAAPASVAPATPEPDPVAAASEEVRASIAAGELGLALAKADKLLKDHPDRKESHEAVRAVVKAEVDPLAAKGRYSDALDLLDERAKAREYVSFKVTRRDLLLAYGRSLADKGSTGFADRVYRELVREHPDDLDILRECVERLGGTAEGKSATGTAERAAVKLAKLTDLDGGKLSDPVGWTLLASLRYRAPRYEEAAEKRKLLAERWPRAEEAARGELASKRRDARMNAYLILKDLGQLGPDEELAHHIRNFMSESYTGGPGQKAVDAALDYIEAAAAGPDWQGRLGRTGVDKIEKVPALWSAGAPHDRVAKILTGPLVSISRESILKWASSEEHSAHRQRAFKMLPAIGLADRVDAWKFHKRGLILQGYQFRYPWLQDAIAYFRGQTSSARAAEARKLLEDARARVVKERDGLDRARKREYGANYDANVETLDEALAAFN